MKAPKVIEKISESLNFSPSKHLADNFRQPENYSQRVEIRPNMFLSFNNSYPRKTTEIGRVQSHSASRIKNTKQGIIRKKWTNIDYDNRDIEKNAEIVKLNLKIKSLIRENSVLKEKVEQQSAYYKIKENKNDIVEKVNNSVMEVTFRPQESWESPVKVSRKFPRHIFSIPKFTGKIQ